MEPSRVLPDDQQPSRLRKRRAQRLTGLYALTPDCDDTSVLIAKVTAALTGGASAIQYRHKLADAAKRRMQGDALARVHAARGGLFIVNDDPLLAKEVGADGVHLGQDDASIEAARELLGPDRLIGMSCYDDLTRAEKAVAQGADYVAFGSFYPSAVKPGARKADVALLRKARMLGVPVVAIGGITASNAQALIDAGADALAVISDVFAHDDPVDVTDAAAAIARLFSTSRSTRTS